MSMRIVVMKAAAESAPRSPVGADVDVVVVENVPQLAREARRGAIDGVVVVDAGGLEEGAAAAVGTLVATKAPGALVLAGLPAADACEGMRWLLTRRHGGKTGRGLRAFRDLTLEECIESKFGEFVRAMKASSSRSLHATLIRAVEGPLIRHALRETEGNQIQAARLLGMNRNTLRKKIKAYRIAVKRRPPSRQRLEAVS